MVSRTDQIASCISWFRSPNCQLRHLSSLCPCVFTIFSSTQIYHIMSFSGSGFRGSSFRSGPRRGGSSDRGFRGGGRRGFSGSRGQSGGFRGRGGFPSRGGYPSRGFGRRDDWSTGFEAGRSRSPKRDDRFGGHTQDSDHSHHTQFKPQMLVKGEEDHTSRPIIGGDSFSSKLPERKPSKMGRIIIRNLPFTTKEDDLKNLMGKCGKIMEVRIPLKDDGKMRGFAFVQFQSINSAETAIKMFNASKLKDRPIAVDWAVAKSRYDEALAARELEAAAHVKTEDDEKNEDEDEKSEDEDEKTEDEEDEKNESGSEKTDEEDEEKEKSDEEMSEKDEDGNEEEDEDEDEDAEGAVKKKKPRTPKKPSDVEEGRTLFIRNLPYEETEESLLKFFRKFGVVKYFKLCIHADSGHSKGSGFVQYREKESADRCLSAASSNDGILIEGRALLVCLAEEPKKRRKAEKEKHEKPVKDNRNLSLLKEGRLVLEKDSDPISQNDMRKRAMLDKKKMETLKNLHMFVSPTRLSVHNIPKSVDDVGLKEMFLKAAKLHKSSIKESRVIRDLQTLDHTGVGKSRGFGFMEFKTHADAAKALAAVNNNPTIFKSEKRPIVEFALENKVALQKKQRRMENSKAKLMSLKGHQSSTRKSSVQQMTQSRLNQLNQPNQLNQHSLQRSAEVFRKVQTPSGLRQTTLGRQPQSTQQQQWRQQRSSAAAVDVDGARSRREAPRTPVEPKKKAVKRKRVDLPDEQDDFSKTVEKYKKRLLLSENDSKTKSSRWFDD